MLTDHMSAELQTRARAWIEHPFRRAPEYPHDGMADWFIASYATSGRFDLQPDFAEYLRASFAGAFEAATQKSGDEAAFFRETALILRAIQVETMGR